MTCGQSKGFFLLIFCLFHESEQSCPSVCLCISDTVSCSSSGLVRLPWSLPSFSVTLDLSHNYLTWLGPRSFSSLPRLENLWMAHNQISTLSYDVFKNLSGLRHLDLSSNKLEVLKQYYFQGLWRLEELRLFNNKIAQVEAGALSHMSSLKKVYISFNQITYFPFFSIQEHSHPFLVMLDLSSNRLTRLPWEDVKALPGLVQRGLYLHNNSLLCDCTMYSLFWHWNLRGYNSVKDFTNEHTCNIHGDPRASIKFLHHSRFFLNCTVEKAVTQPVTVLLSSMVVLEGDKIRLDCQTTLSGAELSFTWLSPSRGFLAPASGNGTLISVFSNGTLQIEATSVNDSGLYQCTAVDSKRGLNATREVNVSVLLPAAGSFNTGYTTLLGCIVTLILILVYVFLTPCRCRHCKEPAAAYHHSNLSSAFSSTRDKPKIETFKHVAFMEPMISEEGKNEWGTES
ncbi:amphoterin-induced protein 3 [Menidia menidia]|uniref:(Atlantic silverside) hypothetical protein n=1 Tax=Menidia menidia TaxID=238744 RepID=A0A8S4BRA8_9TELE|nr:unnamed protein product [Menidia menidia]